ncbi:MAG: hypothetical protein PF689_05315 [Deltaproteobacteria bacterium]|nr:hypothetical protein [Deltaproteobacteria bacterium]
MSVFVLLSLYLSSVQLQTCNFYHHFPLTVSTVDHDKNQIALHVHDLTTNKYIWRNLKITAVGDNVDLAMVSQVKKIVITGDNKIYLLQGNKVFQFKNGFKSEIEIQEARDITKQGKVLYFFGKNGIGKIEGGKKQIIFNSLYLTSSTRLAISETKLLFINNLGVFSYSQKTDQVRKIDARGGKKLGFFKNTFVFLKGNVLFRQNSSIPLTDDVDDFWVTSDRIWIRKNQQTGYWQNGNFITISAIRGKSIKVFNNKLLATDKGLFLCAQNKKKNNRKKLLKIMNLSKPIKIKCKMPDFLPVIHTIGWNKRLDYLVPAVQFSFEQMPRLQLGQNGLFLRNSQKVLITFSWKFPFRKREPAIIREKIKMQKLHAAKEFNKYQRCLNARNLARRYREKEEIPLEILIKIEELLASFHQVKKFHSSKSC